MVLLRLTLVLPLVLYQQEQVQAQSVAYTLELLHISDQEGNPAALADAPRLSAVVAALKAQDLFNDGMVDNTLFLSSGDAMIPGLFQDASLPAYGLAGIGDYLIQNELGIAAVAFGNHEFDKGTGLLKSLIGAAGLAPPANTYPDTAFPYLSCNLDFSANELGPLQVPDHMAPRPKSIARSVVIDVNGEKIGVVGATTPLLATISSPGNVVASPAGFASPPTAASLNALVAIIQSTVNALLAANPTMNKVILLAHMQQLSVEQELATRLTNVDIIVAGGSHLRLMDANDRLRAGDSVQGTYPIFVTDAAGDTVAIVNTDANYKYVGRLKTYRTSH
jgi:2',3'-cyclic-nucleotide 2'-phosphodiesterase / 3'-nucleotidase / 5'-nucleotidase